MPEVKIVHGDCAEVLKTLADCSVDSIVTDPPSGIRFMNKKWDDDKGGRDSWIAWLEGVMKEALRVLKPGGHAIVWALPRTSHWTATAIENSGFEIRDRISEFYDANPYVHALLDGMTRNQMELFAKAFGDDAIMTALFGTGYPKGLDIAKAVDALLLRGGTDSTRLKKVNDHDRPGEGRERKATTNNGILGEDTGARIIKDDAGTPEGASWAGWNTTLKPGCEHWIVARKPLDLGTSVAVNVLKHGTGAINIDATRIQFSSAEDEAESKNKNRHADFGSGPRQNVIFGEDKQPRGLHGNYNPPGRWPTNAVFVHSTECKKVGVKKFRSDGGTAMHSKSGDIYGDGSGIPLQQRANYAGADGMEVVDDWICAPTCPVRILNEKDGAARFFNTFQDKAEAPFLYTPKPSASERDEGLPSKGDSRANTHTTVKAIELCKWLCRLITPKGGTILDPFAGSGSVGVAAVAEGFSYLGIEAEAEYVEIARGRIAHAEKKLFDSTKQRTLF